MKVTVSVVKDFPFEHNGVLIGKTPVEVEKTPWIEAQINAGLLHIAASASKPEVKPAEVSAEKPAKRTAKTAG